MESEMESIACWCVISKWLVETINLLNEFLMVKIWTNGACHHLLSYLNLQRSMITLSKDELF